ncbi:MBL fold metallo-hydrolase [Halovivax gelatinilyticus]|uniref:MBL fold metallo-hydrolase n=1 Tax=Halovivax gelatinilyticus TaxID=2961597 RepID=UPI0020CA6C65|nr:MBL fold metallo-hydrolase [Halovivax gelatinilyticus]
MSESDWGDWLVREIESADPETVSLWYLGCNGFVLKGADGTTLTIDPYVGLGDPPRTVRMIPVPFDPSDFGEMDAVLATHEHTDHVHGPSQAPILAQTGASFFAPSSSIDVALSDERWTDHWSVERSQFTEVSVGDTFEVGGFTISVESANDPDAQEPVSYLLEYDGVTIFHGGDTRPAAEFERIGSEYDIDFGILAFGTVGMIPDKQTGNRKRTRWYNDENQIIEAAASLQLDQLIPSHWDMWRGMTADPTSLRHHGSSFQYPNRLTILSIGDHLSI